MRFKAQSGVVGERQLAPPHQQWGLEITVSSPSGVWSGGPAANWFYDI